jgi:predicted TIM-barrel fold metal-dependent hydrolase
MAAGQLKVVGGSATEAPVYNGPIFDGDSHIQERDFSMFEKYLPKKYHKDWLIKTGYNAEGKYTVFLGDTEMHNFEISDNDLVFPPGKLKEWLAAISTGKEIDVRVPISKDMYTLQGRVEKLDEFGVESCLLFVGLFVAAFGWLHVAAQEKGPEGANATIHAYNQYLLDEWTFNYQDRIYTTPIIALWDREWAIQEARWLVENGARAVLLLMGPGADNRSAADPYYDPVWNILNDAGVLLTLHVADASFMHPLIRQFGENPIENRRKGQTAWQWMFTFSEIPVMMTMANYIYWNFFERFPRLRMASVENGAEWLPRFLYKMDKMRGMARSGYWPAGQLKQRPSAIFKRHCFVVAYPEDNVKKIVDEIGTAECLLMGSDYPHPEGVPAPRDFVHEALNGLNDEQIAQIMYENGRRMMPKGRTGA